MGRIEREETNFQSAPDTRFGGNIARANVGAQYPRGGVDVRYENYRAPHRVDYTRNVPRQTGTPTFRPPYGAPGQPSYPEWMQSIDPNREGQPSPKQHPNPRMRHINTRQMRQPTPPRDLAWHDIHPYTWNRMMHGPEFPGTHVRHGYEQPDEYGRMRPTLPNPYEGATIGGGWDDYRTMEEVREDHYNNLREEGMMGGLGGLQEQAAIDPSDWRILQQIIKAGGNPDDYIQTSEMGGYGYNPDPYDDEYNDEYGPFIPPSVIDMDLEGIGYDPADDEYDFDRKRGFPGRKFGRGYKGPKYAASGGLMSLRR